MCATDFFCSSPQTMLTLVAGVHQAANFLIASNLCHTADGRANAGELVSGDAGIDGRTAYRCHMVGDLVQIRVAHAASG